MSLRGDVRAVIRFYGIVQGVGMRFFVWRVARRLGLRGYVRNVEDGSVEVVVEGPKNLVEELIATVRSEGPGFVSDVRVRYESPKGDFRDFQVVT